MPIDTAVVLAAGEGARLRPLTAHRPKPMLPAGDRPILAHVLDALLDAGIDDLHLVVGYGRDRVQDHFGHAYRDHSLTYHHQAQQLGTGHAVLQAADAVDDDFLVVNGDDVVAADIVADVLTGHADAPEAAATLGVLETDRAPQYGAVELDGDRVVAIRERPESDHHRLLNLGVYAFTPAIFAEIEATPRRGGEFALPDTIARLVDADEPVRGILTEGIWQDATYPWDLLDLAETVLDSGLVEGPARAEGVHVAPSAAVHDAATLTPPVVLGPDAVVGPGAVVGPYAAVGRNVTVGTGAVVERSVIDDDARVGRNATAAETVTGQHVRLGDGVVVPGGPGDVRVGDRIHEGCRLGGLVADRARLGGGVTVAPGTLIGPDARVEPGVVVEGRVGDGERVVR
ncbi:MAG: sugar phosphate nucleotidyltransferase [Haloferacaceae archaeon]